ncbi:hypothetical protein CsSME_00051712 [Camellia sinensis var. sinensis]
MFIHWTKLSPGRDWGSFMYISSPSQGIVLLNRFSRPQDSSSGIPSCRGRFDPKNGGVGQMKKGAVTGSISQIETRLRLSPAVDSSQPTCKFRHCEFFHLTGSRSLIPVIVPMYLLVPDSSVSNIIRNRMPRDI